MQWLFLFLRSIFCFSDMIHFLHGVNYLIFGTVSFYFPGQMKISFIHLFIYSFIESIITISYVSGKLRFLVLLWPSHLAPYVLPHVSRVIRAHMSYMRCSLRALVSPMSHTLCILVLCVPRVLCALVHCAPCSLCPLVFFVLDMLQVPHTLHTAMHLMSL